MRNMINMNKKQSGFTLIELVMVIVILGILSAFALPRFADLSVQAQASTRDGIEGGMISASAIAHAACLADNGCDQNGATDTLRLDNVDIAMVYGYPAATAAGIGAAAQLENVSAAYSAGTATITIATNCTATYVAATASGTPPVISAPTFGGDETACSN